ncbi:hypothetical protein LY90DRAFT_663470 [Neocallimastix californiae]|uniref:Right handed beta helix domain-containing protein n=1 Tax=Neocallimastix californiae TaxID=1754190 RepID=A0A1Y2FMM5_9FUNG|nr:hypothetical protein LY90DRAFT_663470 [Neocallimastix californiae]|eukprot:ORY85198.1 hypothetical protein LY90DRAFT_663470 [Neocallimastix californiae]
MNKILKYLYSIILIILFLIFIGKVKSLELIIRNNDPIFPNLNEVLDYNQNNNELILRFVDDYYDLTKLLHYSIDVSVTTNITLIGCEKKTIFDYKNNKKGVLLFTLTGFKKDSVRIENIIFENYYTFDVGYNEINLFYLKAVYNTFYFHIKNCIFRNNIHTIGQIEVENHNLKYIKSPQVVIENCEFYNNKERILKIRHNNQNSEPSPYQNLSIRISNCTFINNRSLIHSNNAKILIDNSYFSQLDIDSYDDTKAVIYYSTSSDEYLIIKNCVFEDINIQKPYPLFNSNNLLLQYMYLISWKIINFIFLDSIFKNIYLKNSLPGIADATYSSFSITNTEFNSFKLRNGLFGDDSIYHLSNVKLKNIVTNSKYLFHFLYSNTIINYLEAENISCIGDSDDSAFILFDSGELYRTLIINHLNLRNCTSNGPLIKFIGTTNELLIKKSNFINVSSYGPIIENFSNTVNIKK